MPASRTSDEESPPTMYEACGIPLRRSQRPAWSCTECTRRKIKCSKQVPCTACERKKRGHLCRIEPHGPATSLRNAARLISECNPDLRLASGAELDHLRTSVSDLQARVRHLEGFIERILPYVPESARAEYDTVTLLSQHAHHHQQHIPHPHDPTQLVSFPHPDGFLINGPSTSTSSSRQQRILGTGQHTPVTDSGLTGSPHSPTHSHSHSSGPHSHHSHESDSEHHSPLSPAPSPPASNDDVKPLWGPGGDHHGQGQGQGQGHSRREETGSGGPVSGWATPAGMMSIEELSGGSLLPQAGVPMYGFGETLGMYAGQGYTLGNPTGTAGTTTTVGGGVGRGSF